MYITFVWKIRFEQIQHFLSTLIIFCAVPDVPRWLTGGLVSLLLLMFIILIVYKMFKIELVLWYRNSRCAFVSKEGMWMWPLYVSVTSLLLFIFFLIAITSKQLYDCLIECIWNFLENFQIHMERPFQSRR